MKIAGGVSDEDRRVMTNSGRFIKGMDRPVLLCESVGCDDSAT
jgi:hypothetical protein